MQKESLLNGYAEAANWHSDVRVIMIMSVVKVGLRWTMGSTELQDPRASRL